MAVLTLGPSQSNHDARQATTAMTLTGTINLVGAAYWGGLLLTNVSIASPGSVNSATLYYKATSTLHDDPIINWHAEDSDSASVFTATDSDIQNRPRTDAYTLDSASAIGTTTYRAIDVTAQIVEVMGRAGWASGNNIALIGDGLTGTDVWFASWDTGTSVWYVEIDYTSGTNTDESVSLGRVVGATPTAVAATNPTMTLGRAQAASQTGPAASLASLPLSRAEAATLSGKGAAVASVLAALSRGLVAEGLELEGTSTIYVAAGSDDASEIAAGSVFLTGTHLALENSGDVVGFIFRGINAPRQSTIPYAYISMFANDAARRYANVTVRAEGLPADFSTTNYDLSGRDKTTESVQWVNAAVGSTGTVEISAVIKEVIDDVSWTPGSDIAVFLTQNSDTGSLSLASIEYNVNNAAYLIISWGESGLSSFSESVILGNSRSVDAPSVAAAVSQISFARALGASAVPMMDSPAFIALARSLGMPISAAFSAIQALSLSRSESVAASSNAATTAALVVGRALGLSDSLLATAVNALEISRSLGAEVTVSSGASLAIALARVHGLTNVDGFTVLESVVLGRVLNLTTTSVGNFGAAVTLALARAIANDNRLDATNVVSLSENRTVTFHTVQTGTATVVLSRALGISTALGMFLSDAIAIGIRHGISVADIFGYLVSISLARGESVSSTAAGAATAGFSVEQMLGVDAGAIAEIASAVNLTRVHDVGLGITAELLATIGLGVYFSVTADGVSVILTTPRRVVIVNTQDDAWVIDFGLSGVIEIE